MSARLVNHAVLLGAMLVLSSCHSVAPPQAVPVSAPPTQVAARPPSTARLEPRALPGPSIAPLNAMQRFRGSLDSMVADPQFSNAHWGILIVDPERGDTLYAHNDGKLFMPASNQKIVTSAVALTQLGADYRWRTVVEMRGATKAHIFRGDVIVRGRGDPSWSDAMQGGAAISALSPIVDALAARGITRIEGSVIAEGNAFSDEPTGFGWAFDDFDFGYSAPVDELLFNEGFFVVMVRAGQRPGGRVTVSTKPTLTYPNVVVRAVARERNDTLRENRTIEVKWDSTATAVVVNGTLPLGDSVNVEVAYRHPNDAAIAAIVEAIKARGIRVVTPPIKKAARTQAKSGLGTIVSIRAPDTLVVLTSPPLRDVLKRLEKPSQNQMAEALYKTVALEKTGIGRADSARALVQRQLVAWGIPPEGIAVRDGSGLSRHDYIAPRTIVRILDIMRTSLSFDALYAALPIAGIDGTIANRMKGTAAENNVHAKTGTVDKARSLSGYVTTADGHMLIFSMLCNNYTVPTRAVERVQDAIAVRLANMRLRDAQSEQK